MSKRTNLVIKSVFYLFSELYCKNKVKYSWQIECEIILIGILVSSLIQPILLVGIYISKPEFPVSLASVFPYASHHLVVLFLGVPINLYLHSANFSCIMVMAALLTPYIYFTCFILHELR